MTNRAHGGARSGLTVALILAGLGAGSSACAPSAPSEPTWADDVRPLMVSRCIRCHDSPPGSDPLSAKALAPAQIGDTDNFNYVNLSDFPPINLANVKRAGIYTSNPPSITPNLFMPPPPAAKLADWQIEMLNTWGKNPQ